MPLEVEVVSQVRRLYHTDHATMVIIPGSEGVMGVLPNHTPLLTTLSFGELRIVEGEDVVSFVVYGGVVEVRPHKVTVLADDAEVRPRTGYGRDRSGARAGARVDGASAHRRTARRDRAGTPPRRDRRESAVARVDEPPWSTDPLAGQNNDDLTHCGIVWMRGD